ncbi:hypothetical protein [Nocardia sp. NPDC019395]|uniref:hypothetical protein n=1 Tax=Nocardia sp. NPDC019395 TaxID=3154686 RepID=UPI0033C871D3
MAREIEVDADGLRSAAELLGDIGDSLTSIGARANAVMDNMTGACGDDHFGHEFTDGPDGYRARCHKAAAGSDDMGKAFNVFAEDTGDTGAARAWDNTEDASADNLRRVV